MTIFTPRSFSLAPAKFVPIYGWKYPLATVTQ